MNKRNIGFTLVELIVVIVILAILVGITVGGIYMYIGKAKLNTDINNLKSMCDTLDEVLLSDETMDTTFSEYEWHMQDQSVHSKSYSNSYGGMTYYIIAGGKYDFEAYDDAINYLQYNQSIVGFYMGGRAPVSGGVIQSNYKLLLYSTDLLKRCFPNGIPRTETGDYILFTIHTYVKLDENLRYLAVDGKLIDPSVKDFSYGSLKNNSYLIDYSTGDSYPISPDEDSGIYYCGKSAIPVSNVNNCLFYESYFCPAYIGSDKYRGTLPPKIKSY